MLGSFSVIALTVGQKLKGTRKTSESSLGGVQKVNGKKQESPQESSAGEDESVVFR